MRILVVVFPERRDFYNYLEADKENDYLLLWYESKQKFLDSKASIPSFFKNHFFWDQFISPQSLLKKIKPDRIVFFEIIDQRQIALIVAARKKNITTIYLEHGAAGSKEAALERAEYPGFLRKQKLPYMLDRLKYSVGHVLRTKVFYYSNLSGFSKLRHLFSYWKLPFLMLKHTPNKALNKCLFSERVPKISIVFNKTNFYSYQLYTGISESEALFTGIPYFDNYYRSEEKNNGHIVYIEHPYLEQNLMNWTIEHHHLIAQKLVQFANSRKIKLYVKLHPVSKQELWKDISKDDAFVQIIQAGNFTELYLSSALILGYSSSLITGLLCARKNIVNLGWHPEPQIFGVDFSKTGLTHRSLAPNDLGTKFDYWINHNLSQENENLYQDFIKEFNYPFDGKATERVINAITKSEIR